MKKILQLMLLMFTGFALFPAAGIAEEQKPAVDYTSQCKEEAEGVDDVEAYVKECVKQLEEIAKEAAKEAEK